MNKICKRKLKLRNEFSVVKIILIDRNVSNVGNSKTIFIVIDQEDYFDVRKLIVMKVHHAKTISFF